MLQAHGGVANFCYGGAAAVEPYYERRADHDFFRELGLRLGQQRQWPHETLQQAMEHILEPAGISWDQWREQGIYYDAPSYNKHERLDEDGLAQGFSTTTGRIELANEYLAEIGSTRLPEPVLTDEHPDYSFTMITGARVQPYWASSYFNNRRFRQMHPEPTAQMSAATLEAAGLQAGQWLLVCTARGKARFLAEQAEMIDGIVSVEYGWWYPEEEQGEPHLSGVWRSNVNLLTSGDIETSEPLLGSWTYNGIPCALQPLDGESARSPN